MIEAFRIPSQSMERTLLIGDHLLVLKVVHGQFIPWTDRSEPLLHGFRGGAHGLLMPATGSFERGEVAVFRYPLDPSRDFIKRIVALEGDTVQVISDTLFVNGEPSEWASCTQSAREPGIIDDSWPEGLSRLRGRVADLEFDRISAGVVRLEDGSLAYVVPEHHVFMMGDNRDHSSDSRIWGPLDMDLVKGPALVTYWSWDRSGGLPRIGRMARLIR